MHCTEGIVIHSFPFQDFDQIFSIFTPEQGLVKLLLKGARRTSKGQQQAVSPLTCAEFVYLEGKGEIFVCREVAITNLYLGLRERLESLQAACDLLKAISKTQHPGIASPEVYQLLKIYLTKLETSDNKNAFAASFYLKLLIHEGVLHPHSLLSEQPLSPSFQPQEKELLLTLATCRSSQDLNACSISDALKHRIEAFFTALLR